MSWFRRKPHIRERSTLTPMRSSTITDKVMKQIKEGDDRSNGLQNQQIQEQKKERK